MNIMIPLGDVAKIREACARIEGRAWWRVDAGDDLTVIIHAARSYVRAMRLLAEACCGDEDTIKRGEYGEIIERDPECCEWCREYLTLCEGVEVKP